jgi:hypothetical protein
MNHISRIDTDTSFAFIADLAGGWHLMGTCPICDRVGAVPLTPDETFDYQSGGIDVLEDSPRLRTLLNTHAIKAYGPLTEEHIAVWAASLDAVRNPYQSWTEPTDA